MLFEICDNISNASGWQTIRFDEYRVKYDRIFIGKPPRALIIAHRTQEASRLQPVPIYWTEAAVSNNRFWVYGNGSRSKYQPILPIMQKLSHFLFHLSLEINKISWEMLVRRNDWFDLNLLLNLNQYKFIKY